MDTVIENRFLKATIHHKGAELASLMHGDQNLIWTVDTKFWNKTSPVLFPIVGALKNGTYSYEGENYLLSRHGFARDSEFEVEHQTKDSVIFVLKSSEKNKKVYPFDFEFRISYQLEDKKLLVKYEVKNRSGKTMYYSVGAHPAFSLSGNFEEYALKFDPTEHLISWQLEEDVFSGKTVELPVDNQLLPLRYSLFYHDALVFKNHTTTSLTLLYRNKPQFRVDFPDFPYLGIWTKKDAPFLCIEPWQGIADAKTASGKLEEKEGIRALRPSASEEFQWAVEVLD